MSIIQSGTFNGVEHNDARPGRHTYTSVMLDVIEDQAHLYETLTGAAVPNAGSQSATSHTHNGTNGAPIRIPICQQRLSASLGRRSAAPVSGGTDYADYSPLVWTPFWCPTGVTKMYAILWLTDSDGAHTFKAEIQDTSFSSNGSEPYVFVHATDHPIGWLFPDSGEMFPLAFEMETNPGAVNLLKISAWDGYYTPDVPDNQSGATLPDIRAVRSLSLIPTVKPPARTLRYTAPAITTSSVKVPSSFTSFDSALVADDRSINSYVLVNMQKNDALLYEVATGKPAGNRASATFSGHNHEADAATSLDKSGAEIEQPLGAWFYGTIRPPVGDGTGSTSYAYTDVIGNGIFGNEWGGGVNAITLESGAGTTLTTVATHTVRIPAATAANLASGTGKLNAAALVYKVTGGDTIEVGFALADKTGTSYGTEQTASSATGGRQVLTVSGIQCTSSPAGEIIATLRVRLRQSVAKDADTFLYGTCLWYEP